MEEKIKPKDQTELGKITRRTFLGGSAALGGILAMGAVTTSASTVPATTGIVKNEAGFNLPTKHVDEPTYVKDIVGKIERYDEREHVWSQCELFPGTPEYEEFYNRHPDWEEHNPKIRAFWDMEFQCQREKDDLPNYLLMSGTFFGAQILSLENQVDGPVSPNKIEVDPKIMAEKIKGYCNFLGAPLVTIGPLKEEWLFSIRGYTHGLEQNYNAELNQTWKYAISIGVPQDYEMIATGINAGSVNATGQAYAQIAQITCQVAAYIRNLGYRARASNFGNYVGLSVPIAVDSGMGEMGRTGYVVSKEYGTNFRIGQILTDLPMALDKAVDLGVQDFCSQCKLCAEWCPSGAISMGEKEEVNGVKKWKIDPFKCLEYWATETHGQCGLCMVNCPWSKPTSWIHSMAVESATHSAVARKLLPKAEKMVYGKWVNHEDPDWIKNSRK